MLIAARGDIATAKSAAAVYSNVIGVGPNNGLHVGVDVADKATVVQVPTGDVGTDADNISSRGDVGAGTLAQGRVRAARAVVQQRTITNCHVQCPGGVVQQRLKAVGRVAAAGGVA